jgi:hypothetical protein
VTPLIELDGSTVRIIGGGQINVPRRQSFAWPSNALEYARRLSREHGWPIEERRG